ncbi:MAG: division/cell wall cluster transcriptional repressor MraZ [Firmicutes bacterium]|nr:division/cell wall cluster transcriptional repressor MraZ [Bacillota bacterium]MBQ3112601.1 division/cell wall cluster transcriptional repressor MraZ [Bacillota bacterium]MBR6823704.1 division/cell wall cluster transcriptional repressor MraZ [Bacillota bacterium]MBR7113621.1 division/cell wall cluster transcriptional repressor MraZ [Bacillota bacterium]
MLIGEVGHSLDAKGRYIVPARFREELGSRFIVTKGLDHCLFVYTVDEWERVMRDMLTSPTATADARKMARIFFAGALEAEVDKQFRVVLPAGLREYAGLEKEIVTVGVASRLEIWDKEAWAAYSEAAQDEYEAVAEKCVGLRI